MDRRDRAAFAALFGFYAPRIKTMLMRMGAGAEAAEDIAQKTLLTIWRKAAQFDPARASGGLGLCDRAQSAGGPAAPRPAG
jgi:RNA polymerase sigma-70 factor (ECF subfamily)